ncbi:MFS transporter [Dactylosporangium sp. CA-092794]|uniref:MFS transporter n=1 Tax=Dactylosporangium sp. CA-092794 TaxID=3239929 RepID=UPI003D8B9C58
MTATLFTVSIDQTSVLSGLTAIRSGLGVALPWVAWVVAGYSLGQMIALPTAGLFGARFPRKRIFLIAVAVFAVTGCAAAGAGNIYELIACRTIQGFAYGTLVPTATGIVSHYYGAGRKRAIALFTSAITTGAIIGPAVGSAVVLGPGWRALFLVSVLPLALAFAAGTALIGHTGAPGAAKALDVPGVLLLAATVLTATLAITVLGKGELPLAIMLALLAGPGVWLILRRSRRHCAPLIPAALLTGRHFGALNLTNLLFGAAAIGSNAMVPTYAQLRYGLGAAAAGTLLTVRAIGMAGSSTVTSLLIRRYGSRRPALAGLAGLVAGLLILVLPPPLGLPHYPWLLAAAGLSGVCAGLAAPGITVALLHVAPAQTATITGMRSMFRQTGSILAVSLTAAVAGLSADQGAAQACAFAVLAGLAALAFLFLRTVPEDAPADEAGNAEAGHEETGQAARAA